MKKISFFSEFRTQAPSDNFLIHLSKIMIAYEFSYTISNIVLINFNDNIEIVNTNTNTKNYS